jgi:hypothetical protein
MIRIVNRWIALAPCSVVLLSGCCTAAKAVRSPAIATQQDVAQRIQRARATRAGTFSRLDRRTLKFEGHISQGAYQDYLRAIDDGIETLVINSPGGDVYEAVRIGTDMAKRSLTVIVDGVAGSSAANYLFAAGRRKVLRTGFVGFHGNAKALLAAGTQREEIIKAARRAKFSQQQLDKILSELQARLAEIERLEKELFSNLGISQGLFDLTQDPGKGLRQSLGIRFEFLLPSLRTMERFGIRNVGVVLILITRPPAEERQRTSADAAA